MSTLPIITITVDKDQPGGPGALLGAAAAGDAWNPDTGVTAAGASGVAFMALDAFELHIVFDDVDSDDDFMFDAGCVVSCSLALLAELTEADAVAELLRVTPFTRNTDDYSAFVNLDSQDILVAVGDAVSVPCVLDIRVVEGSSRVTYRVPVTLYRPALGDTASSDAIATEWANVAGAQMRQRPDGLIEFYDFALAKWVVPVLKNGVIEYQENA